MTATTKTAGCTSYPTLTPTLEPHHRQVYFFAFLVALRQNKALIGDRGITPAKFVLNVAEAHCDDAGAVAPRRGWDWWAPRLAALQPCRC